MRYTFPPRDDSAERHDPCSCQLSLATQNVSAVVSFPFRGHYFGGEIHEMLLLVLVGVNINMRWLGKTSERRGVLSL